MKKILLIIGLIFFLINSAYSNDNKCADFKKFSKNYLKCSTNKIKDETVSKAEIIKESVAKKSSDLKKGIMKLTIKANSKLKKSE